MLRINTLGGLTLWAGDNPITGPGVQPRRLALLALLARAGTRGMTRDKIVGLIWPDTEEERARRLLTQALYAVRREMGDEDAILGMQELRLNAQIVTSDVAEFAEAIDEGQLERAAKLYRGPFIDGFRLTGAPEFERWAEDERAALAHTFTATLEKLAKQAGSRGEHAAAVEWWRTLASHDPLNSRVALGLMHALVATGDRHAAIQHARLYEALVEQELEMDPDAEVVALAKRLREQQSTAVEAPSDETPRGPAPPVAVAPPVPGRAIVTTIKDADAAIAAAPAGARHDGIPSPRRRWPVAAVAGLALGTFALVALAIYTASAWRARGSDGNGEPAPVIAVGRIADYRTGAHAELARPLADMLATNLARSQGVRVVSTARLYELMRQMASVNDSSGVSHVQAARQAGATRILEGTLYGVEDGDLRLDLRLVDLRSGNVAGAYSTRGADAFALADSGTAQLLTDVGAALPTGSLADVTTRSVSAYRLYEEGLRHLAAEDSSSAVRLFESALAEDSTFAMAAFYMGRASETNRLRVERMRRAQRLAGRATDRERLIIRAGWAHQNEAPELAAIAETLAVRYPDEVEGHLYAGVSAVQEGQFERGLRYLNHVVGMDSLGLPNAKAGCAACEAMDWIAAAYQLMDSMPNAEREARRWVRLQPRSPSAWRKLSEVLDTRGRVDEALQANRTAVSLSSPPDGGLLDLAVHHIRHGRYADADPLLRQLTLSGVPLVRADGYWFLAIGLRQRGRLTEALDAARAFRRVQREFDPFKRAVTVNALGEGQVLFELGHYATAAALFDSISRIPPDSDLASARARNRGWALTHVATARAAMGDTLSLRWLADSIEALGALTGRGRDRRLHHHIRGLLWIARGESGRAISQLRSAIYSPTFGYTRTNYELGKLYLGLDRPGDAVAVLAPALRGAMEASNLYITRTELHELLARAHDRAGARDSAAAHYAAVVAAWAGAEPRFETRWSAARDRLAVLLRR